MAIGAVWAMLATATTAAAVFDDVPEGVFYTDAVAWMADEGITTGTSPTTFDPLRTVTRGEFATFMWRFAGEPSAPASGFNDVPAGAFYADAVGWMSETGITVGTSATTFSPNDTLTRAQAATFIWRYMCEPAASGLPFTDVEAGRFFTTAVAWMAEEGITTGTSPTMFSPFNEVSRAQTGTFLWRLAGEPAVGVDGANRTYDCGGGGGGGGGGEADISLSVTDIDFGDVPLGGDAVAEVTISNSGDVAATVGTVDLSLSASQAGPFSSSSPSSTTVPAGGAVTIDISFEPAVAASFDGTVTATVDGTPYSVTFDGSSTLAPVYRINAGGDPVGGAPSWSSDLLAAPSGFSNSADTNSTTLTPQTVDLSDSSVPSGTPAILFNSERWDNVGGAEMEWDFPLASGTYLVRQYFAETFAGAQVIGGRVFDINIEGSLAHNDLDIFAQVGANTALVLTDVVTVTDGNLDLDYIHGAADNPAVKGIEIIPLSGPSPVPAVIPVPESFSFGAVNVVDGATTGTISVANPGTSAVSITSIGLSGSSAFSKVTNSVVVPAKGVAEVQVSFDPSAIGQVSTLMTLNHNASHAAVVVPVSGIGTTASGSISFTKSTLDLAGLLGSISAPTSLSWGPDGWLYVAEQGGEVHALEITRTGADDYEVTDVESTSLVEDIQNHDDDGTVNNGENGRLVTGLLAVGTPSDPLIYVTSSDPRIGAGPGGGTDTDVDTNSGIISVLTRDGSSWTKQDLVRGLPRSEENHVANGMALDTATNTLYVQVGGNTNTGNISTNFLNLPEYALSAALLSVDLDAIGGGTWDLVTLDDPDRPGTNDANDPFGGNGGKNQAIIDADGPVQIYAPGFRNAYDIVLHSNGEMYTSDNGGNSGWGGAPTNEGPSGNCTYSTNDGGGDDGDVFHHVTGPGYYGGHPNPTRGNSDTSSIFGGASPIAEVGENPIECDYVPDENRGLTQPPLSTNGLTEYTATNFGGAMQGDIIAASYYSGVIWRASLNGAGTDVDVTENLASGVGTLVLDVDAMSDAEAFPGTLWITDYVAGAILILEPGDYDGALGPCNTDNDPFLDGDSDTYDNADEIMNGTNPCSAGDTPPDADGDGTSDLNDFDDDNDGTPDAMDPFPLDAADGVGATGPIVYDWQTPLGDILNLGFTGHMTNGTDEWSNLFDQTNGTFIGAGGVATINSVPHGTAALTSNDQEFGLQLGVDRTAETDPFTVKTRLKTVFAAAPAQAGQEQGIFFGTGDQSNYVQLVATATGVELRLEVGDAETDTESAAVTWSGAAQADLEIIIDPGTDTATGRYSLNGGVTWVTIGSVSIPGTWLDSVLATGIISTAQGAPAFGATWDFFEVS